MTPPPTGTSAVFTGVPLGAAALDDADPDDVADQVDVDDPVVAAADVVLDAAPQVAGGVAVPPHAASAAAAATPAPPTPADRSTVRRSTADRLVSDRASGTVDVVSG